MEPKIPLGARMGGGTWSSRGYSAKGAATQQSICDTRAGPAVAALPLLHPSPGSRISSGMGMLVFITRVCQSCISLNRCPWAGSSPAASSMALKEL